MYSAFEHRVGDRVIIEAWAVGQASGWLHCTRLVRPKDTEAAPFVDWLHSEARATTGLPTTAPVSVGQRTHEWETRSAETVYGAFDFLIGGRGRDSTAWQQAVDGLQEFGLDEGVLDRLLHGGEQLS